MLKSFAVIVALIGSAVAVPVEGDKVVPEPRAGSCQFSYGFTSVGQQAYLQSPNWPSSYPNNANCRYSISSPAGTKISINCDQFNVEYSASCIYDRMTISFTGDATMSDGKTVCGQGSFNRTTTTNALEVTFTSDSSNPATSSLFRFQCILTVEGTPATTKAPAAPTTVKPAQTTAKPAQTTAKPAQTSAKPAAGQFANDTCSCGTRNENTRIVGGTEAMTNEFPWRTAMYSPNFGVFCGATIISPNWVLTAAHCTAALGKSDELYADVGDHDLTTTAESVNQVIKCDRVIQHAKYDSNTQDNDVSLCHLEKPLTYSRIIQPVCLPWSMRSETFQGKTVTASGWGTTSSGGDAAMVLRKVDLPVKTTEECKSYYREAITDNMFCTYSVGKDTCQGDSGGSIDYKDPNTGRYYGVGVVSWGVGCAGANNPGVYAKVTNYLDWIEAQTAGEKFCR